ncbi:class I adenylate-forming enzyme family protein [Kutzneria albida]|uniref:AMP-dependent synthetase and ligase n=1 Tax=Kutzneria albida DSM 43870 TaxID=1449976 RepID=W5W214_9PSEU|nr:class I adenylate-forming enzyme family protein [Kutzneria albida]AHH95193.1 AMP-dependent synthetase and ligase [Kutzneria albida DSM 43870]
MTWTSTNGVTLRDLVPVALRRQWVEQGHCPDRDLYSLFREQATRWPSRVAVIDDQGDLGYAELHHEVLRLATLLTRNGFGPHDIIATHMHNSRHAVVAELAVAAIGAAALPVPPGRGTADALSLLGRSRASVALVDAESEVPMISGRLPHLRAVFVLPAVLPEPDPGWRAPQVDPEAPARFLVSSGSEAAPKIVAYSHNAFAGGRANYIRAVHRGEPVVRDLLLVSLASSYGSFGVAITLCCLGGTLVLTRRFHPEHALGLISAHRPTHVFAVPTMLRRMVDQPVHANLASLRAVVSSSDMLLADTVHRVRRGFGVDLINIYGSSDGVNCHTAHPEQGVGVPDHTVTEIRIIDGEICARGPMTPLCYLGAPELDSAYRLPGGWVRTGDRGRFDSGGRLHVLGRLRTVVVRGGYGISPAEVEREIAAHPMIGEVVCVPVPDEDLGERMCACVTIRPGQQPPDLGQLTDFLRARGLEPRKLPELLLVLPEFPLAPTSKVCRRTLTRLATESTLVPR